MVKICNKFIIKDLLEYEIATDNSIIEGLSHLELDVIIDVIAIGCKCSVEEASLKLDGLLKQYNLLQITEGLFSEIFCVTPNEDTNSISVNKFSNLTDLFNSFYNELQIVDDKLTLTEFYNMTSGAVYKYADGINKRYINNTNRELQSQYNNVAMLMSALAGSLKDCPRLDEDGSLHKETLIDKIKALS